MHRARPKTHPTERLLPSWWCTQTPPPQASHLPARCCQQNQQPHAAAQPDPSQTSQIPMHIWINPTTPIMPRHVMCHAPHTSKMTHTHATALSQHHATCPATMHAAFSPRPVKAMPTPCCCSHQVRATPAGVATACCMHPMQTPGLQASQRVRLPTCCAAQHHRSPPQLRASGSPVCRHSQTGTRVHPERHP